jgi:acyl carrier protein
MDHGARHMSKENAQKIRDLMTVATGLNVTAEDQPFQSLPGWDSLRFAEFVIALQRELEIRLSPSEIAGLVDLKSAFGIVRNKKGP